MRGCLGLTREQTINALSLAWVDGQSLRTYRHAPNTGSRKSWAAGDATSRAVRLALMAQAGEMGYPSALTAKTWGFYDVSFRGQEFKFQRPYGSYVMENVLFKISYPAEFHAQTAVEAAMKLHAQTGRARAERRRTFETITIRTHEACLRIIDKKGPLANPADRDHCVQYMVAIPLLFGRLTAADYEDTGCRRMRGSTRCARKIDCVEEPQFTARLSRSGEALDRQLAARGARTTARCWKRQSSIRSATSGGARKGCRCWWRNSSAICAAISGGAAAADSGCFARSRAAGRRCRCMSTWICTW